MSPKSDSTIVFPAQSADHDTPPLPSGESRPPSGRSGKTPSSGRKGAMRPRRRALDLNRLWMALALGLVTWFVIDFKRMEENTVPVVLSVRTPKDIQIAQLPDRTIEVTLRGSRNAMQAVPRLLRLEAMVDPERIEGNQARVELNESGLQGLPEKVAVLRIEPKEVAVALARRESARLDVEVQVTGEPEKGYNVVNVTAYPTQLAVNGPEVLRLALMRTKLQTEVIDLTGLRRTESRKVNLKPILSEIGVPLEIEQDRKSVV